MNKPRTWKSRTFLAAVICCGVFTAAFLTRCGQSARMLHIYTWADYFKPALVARFERQNGCRVVIDTYDSN